MNKRKLYCFVALTVVFGTSITARALTPKYLNEWMFDQDLVGTKLTAATNSGTDAVNFSGADPVTQTDGTNSLICAYEAAASSLWTDGAVLTADVSDSASDAVRFLRYDFDYDMNASGNDTGTLLAMSFSDGSNANLAGVALKYTPASTDDFSAPASSETTITNSFEFSGHISVIAKLDLSAQQLSAWYDLSGTDTFNASDNPNATIRVSNLTSVEELVFQATGDFIATSSNDCVSIDNIRMAETWAEIIEAPIELAADPVLSVELGSAFVEGKTNLISAVISNASGIASNAYADLTFELESGLSIVASNNAYAVIGGGRSVTNDFTVVAETEGAYLLTSTAYADGGVSSEPVTLSLAVGERISYVTNTVANDLYLRENGIVEPGETFELTVVSVNDGARSVSSITNSLIADDSAFTVLSAQTADFYASLAVDETASTTYEVVCSADATNGDHSFSLINQAGESAWTNQFSVNVLRESTLNVDSTDLTLWVAPGESVSDVVSLENNGNVSSGFSVSFADTALTAYETKETNEHLFTFDDPDSYPETTFTNWSEGETVSMEIGFDFPIFGEVCTEFTVSTNGTLTLESDAGTVDLVVFDQDVAQDSIRYTQRYAGRLDIAWGWDGTDNNASECQIRLYEDGTVYYLYEKGTWGSGSLSIGDQSISYTPRNVQGDCLELTPVSWVSCSPMSGTLAGMDASQALTFVAEAPDWFADGSSNSFDVVITGDDNSTALSVTVVVETPSVELSVPSDFTFYGSVGAISAAATMAVTNTGNLPLTYQLTDTNEQSAGYEVSYAAYSWYGIPLSGDTGLSEADMENTALDIGFDFLFDGVVYTKVTVGLDGLRLGDNSVPVFDADLVWDDNTSVRFLGNAAHTVFVVTWENLALSGGAEDQTFQALLYSNGSFRFNYQLLEGSGLMLGDDPVNKTSYADESVYLTDGELAQTGGTVGESNVFSQISRQSIEAVSSYTRVIDFSPVSGTLSVGATAGICLRGDARGLTIDDASDSVTTNTTLRFFVESDGLYDTNSALITFVATNRVETAASSAAAQVSLWGATSGETIVSSTFNTDGSQTLSWPEVSDSFQRIYEIWYTFSLTEDWTWLATVTNETSVTVDDDELLAEPRIFYKATVE